MLRLFCFTLHLILIALLISVPLKAQELANQAETRLEQLDTTVGAYETQIKTGAPGEEVLLKIQDAASKLTEEVITLREGLKPRLGELKSQLERLGPKPADDKTTEDETIAAEREKISKQFGQYDALDKKAAVLKTRIDQLVGNINSLRRDIFTRQIFRRDAQPFRVVQLSSILEDSKLALERAKALFQRFSPESGLPLALLAGVLLVGLLAWGVLHFATTYLIDRWRFTRKRDDDLPFFHRASSATFVSLARLSAPLIPLGVIYFLLKANGALVQPFDQLISIVFGALILFFAISAMATTLLAPRRPEWRMLPLANPAVPKLLALVHAIAFIFSIDLVLTKFNAIVDAPFSLTTSQNLIVSFSIAFLLMGIALVRFKDGEGEEVGSRWWPVWLKLPLWLAAFAIFISASSGYIALAKFLSSQIVVTAAVLVMAVLLYVAIGELSRDIKEDNSAIGRFVKHHVVHEDMGRHQLSVLVSVLLTLALFCLVIPLILLEWGFSLSDMKTWMSLLFFGLEIGQFRISLLNILIAIALFIFGLLLTRLFQSWLDHGPFELNRFQNGVGTSIRTVIGYTGFILSVLLAVSYAGFDFTNFAIVAGALSVGIGFGLQSIVNNFVSGLILLIERPVKVGDWVIVGEQQGIVRRISVRATEIETFDRTSVIIPNSELITGTVTNKTLGNSVGRVLIRVGVSYSSDVKKVHDLLLEIGQKHPLRLISPPVKVVFEDFGASSLDFCLHVYIADIFNVLKVETDLRMAIFEAFQQQGIEIPFPQRDLHIKTSNGEVLV